MSGTIFAFYRLAICLLIVLMHGIAANHANKCVMYLTYFYLYTHMCLCVCIKRGEVGLVVLQEVWRSRSITKIVCSK